jgi:hypothetical protein
MTEPDACARLKQRFEAAGFKIAEKHPFDEDGVTFEMDGFDAEKRVGYEFVSVEFGDSWDVDENVKATLAARMDDDELYILVIEEADAPDAAALDEKIDEFLGELEERGVGSAGETATKKKGKAKAKPATKKPAAKKKPAPAKKKAAKRR